MKCGVPRTTKLGRDVALKMLPDLRPGPGKARAVGARGEGARVTLAPDVAGIHGLEEVEGKASWSWSWWKARRGER